MIKIAIHHRPGSFSDRWIAYCKENNLEYKLVNAYDSDIVSQVTDCDVFMWHHHHNNSKDILFAKHLLYSLEMAGKHVFPNWETCWHFDDKVGQKYLLEAIGAPLVPSYVFYSKDKAIDWIEHTTFPKVFKLRGGAGSSNVMLVHTSREARILVNKAFAKGFPRNSIRSLISENKRKYKEGNLSWHEALKDIVAHYLKHRIKDSSILYERGYVYFQDFIANNEYDIRIIIVAHKAFAIKRMVRKNDFRASGSGNILYDYREIPEECIKISFHVCNILKAQSLAFDFVFDSNQTPLIVEISYGFAVNSYDSCPGYWTENMKWHECKFNPQVWMIQEILKEIE